MLSERWYVTVLCVILVCICVIGGGILPDIRLVLENVYKMCSHSPPKQRMG